jgi:hypothetical protein
MAGSELLLIGGALNSASANLLISRVACGPDDRVWSSEG